MRTTRPYRPALTIDEAKDELRKVSSTQLDPNLVEILVKLMDNGTLVMTRKELPPEHAHDHPHEFHRVV